MINRVDGNSYYDYTTPKKVDIPDTGEKFSLGYQKDGEAPKLKEEKEKEVSDQEKQQAAERNGVRIELSSKGVEKQKQAEAVQSSNFSGLTSLIDTIRTFFTTTVAALKDIFNKIWNDPQPEEAAETADALEGEETGGAIQVTEIMETADGTETAGTIETMETADVPEGVTYGSGENHDRDIRQHLQKGDMNQVIRLLTDNGRRTVARNSSLLTCYDKNGRIVELDASVRERTLHGDRNTIKL